MQCPRCQHENAADAVFCQECGRRLEIACPGCGTANQLGAKFCKKCGQPLGARSSAPVVRPSPESYIPKHLAEKILTFKSALEGERKHVTVLFADLKGSMELLADRDSRSGPRADEGTVSPGASRSRRTNSTRNDLKRRDINHEIAQGTPWSRHYHRSRIRGVVAHRGPAADSDRRLHGAHRKVRTAGRLRA